MWRLLVRERHLLGEVEIKAKALSQTEAFIRGGRDQGKGN